MAYRILATAVTLLLLLAPAASAAKRGLKRVEVVVKAGDTLGGIAARYGVSLADIRRWNPRRVGDSDMIRLGSVLIVRVPSEGEDESSSETEAPAQPEKSWVGHYTIESGDTLSGIARKLGVSVDALCRWNRMRPEQPIRAGKTLRYEKPGERPRARSIGRPTSGRLVHGEHLGKGTGYRLRFPKNAYASQSVLEAIRHCARYVTRRFPGTADILVGDLSKPAGGSFPPHASHQSGRDADMGYYLKGNKQNKTLHRVWPRELDYAKNWTLLRCMLTRHRVNRIYMDEGIQKRFASYLVDRKLASKEVVGQLFEAVSEAPKRALIRHAAQHDTHMHLRFACDEGDERCEEELRDAVYTLPE